MKIRKEKRISLEKKIRKVILLAKEFWGEEKRKTTWTLNKEACCGENRNTPHTIITKRGWQDHIKRLISKEENNGL